MGDAVGKLTLVARLENQGLRANWLCRCECGIEVTEDTRDLVRWGDSAECTSQSAVHRMSNVDPETKTGSCSVCGPDAPASFQSSLLLWTCRTKRRDSRIRSDHGISLVERDARFEAQGESCAICGRTEPTGKGWATDHDRSCCPGARSCAACFRGVLCSPCNVGLGMFQDNIESLKSAIRYLEGHKS